MINTTTSTASTSKRDFDSSQPQQPIVEELSELCTKLTYQQVRQHLLYTTVCFAYNLTVYFFFFSKRVMFCFPDINTFFSFGLFIRLVEGKPEPFVVIYRTGNILSFLSSTFLCGPSLQFK